MNNNILNLIPRIKELYDKGENIIQYFKNHDKRKENTLQDILISYDFQSGNYINQVEKERDYNEKYTQEIADTINKLGNFNSIIEVGVGEATTLANLIPKLSNKSINSYGFDISWSRIFLANQYLNKTGAKASLFIANLFNIPLNDNSVDIVYTSHSIEPNGGKEKEAIEELYRITNKYLILLEPTYEFANEEGKVRMERNGYVQNLHKTIKELNYKLIEYKPFKLTSNPLNPTGLYIIEKNTEKKIVSPLNFLCPISKSPLKEYTDHYFSENSLISYPKIMNIPCLCDFYGILTSKHNENI